ncbi:cobalamin biosynthesis protein CobW [soil metagenome]
MTKIPITILSGFLGAGKTTLLLDLIGQSSGRSISIIVNEFGSVSIDGQTINSKLINTEAADTESINKKSNQNLEIFNIADALIAYDNDDAFVLTLEKILSSQSHTDNVIIETSGLAVPTAIISKLNESGLNKFFELDALITVVDTPYLLKSFDSDSAQIHDVFLNQLSATDVTILNKIDDLDKSQIAGAEHKLRTMSPTIRFVELAHHAHLDKRVILGLHLNESRAEWLAYGHSTSSKASQSSPVPKRNGHSHSGMEAHDHGLHTHEHLHEHDPGWLSFVLHSHDLQESEKVKAAIQAISQTEPLLRAKGFLKLRNSSSVELQCVRDRITIAANEALHSSPNDSSLVFIGYHLKRQEVLRKLNSMTDSHWN